MLRKQLFLSEWNNTDELDPRDAPCSEELLHLTQGPWQVCGRAVVRPSLRAIKVGRSGRWMEHWRQRVEVKSALHKDSEDLGSSASSVTGCRIASHLGQVTSPLWMGFSFLPCKGEGCTTSLPALKFSFPGIPTQMPTVMVHTTRQCGLPEDIW